jgi:hypothetical protein
MPSSFWHALSTSQNPLSTALETEMYLFADYNPRLIFDKGRPGIAMPEPAARAAAPATAADDLLLSACSDRAASMSSSIDSTAAR